MIYPFMPLVGFIACCSLLQSCSKLLNNVAVSLLTLSSMLPCLFLGIHALYELAIAVLSFINIPSYCWSPCHAMYCSVVSGSSSPTCLLIVVSAMSCYFHQVWICHITCHDSMDATMFSVDLWNAFSKEVLLSAFSTSMPCLILPR